jgi:hypothetical protein
MADTILSLLEPGEYVLNRNAVKKMGKKVLDEINYEEAPRFPEKSILEDYFNQGNQSSIPKFRTGGYFGNEGGGGGPSGSGGDSGGSPGGSTNYSGSGGISYGGYESTMPGLEDLYEMYGVRPNAANKKRFKEYDPSREGVFKEDYNIALDSAFGGAESAMADVYGETAGAGGFSGSGAGEKARKQSRKSLMKDYLSSGKQAKSGLFKSVRGEREGWLKEQGQMLRDLERAEGTEDLSVEGMEEMPKMPGYMGAPPSSIYSLTSQQRINYGGDLYVWDATLQEYVRGY